jgi:hypothetical protein
MVVLERVLEVCLICLFLSGEETIPYIAGKSLQMNELKLKGMLIEAFRIE